MSAAHTRIAKILSRKPESLLEYSLKNPEFWNTQVNKQKVYFTEAGFLIPDKYIKNIFKVGLYTSLNGGNPTSEAIILSNLTTNCEYILVANNLVGFNTLRNYSFWSATQKSHSAIAPLKSYSRDASFFHIKK